MKVDGDDDDDDDDGDGEEMRMGSEDGSGQRDS
jgi:hypothetical protein